MGTYYFNLPLKGLINLEKETWLQLSLRLELFTQTRKHVPSDWDCTHKRMQWKNWLTNLGRSPLAVANGWSRVKERMTWNHRTLSQQERHTVRQSMWNCCFHEGKSPCKSCFATSLQFLETRISSNQSCFHVHPFWDFYGCSAFLQGSNQQQLCHRIIFRHAMLKKIYPKKRRRSISFWLVSYSLDPPFGCQMSGQKGLFLVGYLWGPNFRPNWRIQALSLHYYQGCKVSASRQTNLSSCTDFMDFHGFLWISVDFHGLLRIKPDQTRRICSFARPDGK